MQFMVNIDIKDLPQQISYKDPVLLVGSCFTEHIGRAMEELKFKTLQNPHGILFDPISVARSLQTYVGNTPVESSELFLLNDVWHSWRHHSRFSATDAAGAVVQMNDSIQKAHSFLASARWIIVTLGSSFSYQLTELGRSGSKFKGKEAGVANCHRAPAQWFEKRLLEIEEIVAVLESSYTSLKAFNPGIQMLFTVSPVRHIRDGVIENNRSKARLIESVHQLTNTHQDIHYFPAYELVIDVLRDYRFYDADLVHPNYMATEFVLEKFIEACIDPGSREMIEPIRKLVISRKHKPFQPATEAHKKFMKTQLEISQSLSQKYPYLDFREELNYFKSE